MRTEALTSKSPTYATTNTKQDSSAPLATIEQIERVLWKCTDDLAVSIGRSFEQIEERVDSMESLILARVADLSDAIAAHQKRTRRSAR